MSVPKKVKIEKSVNVKIPPTKYNKEFIKQAKNECEIDLILDVESEIDYEYIFTSESLKKFIDCLSNNIKLESSAFDTISLPAYETAHKNLIRELRKINSKI